MKAIPPYTNAYALQQAERRCRRRILMAAWSAVAMIAFASAIAVASSSFVQPSEIISWSAWQRLLLLEIAECFLYCFSIAGILAIASYESDLATGGRQRALHRLRFKNSRLHLTGLVVFVFGIGRIALTVREAFPVVKEFPSFTMHGIFDVIASPYLLILLPFLWVEGITCKPLG
jgi:hypothetical protein